MSVSESPEEREPPAEPRMRRASRYEGPSKEERRRSMTKATGSRAAMGTSPARRGPGRRCGQRTS